MTPGWQVTVPRRLFRQVSGTTDSFRYSWSADWSRARVRMANCADSHCRWCTVTPTSPAFLTKTFTWFVSLEHDITKNISHQHQRYEKNAQPSVLSVTCHSFLLPNAPVPSVNLSNTPCCSNTLPKLTIVLCASPNTDFMFSLTQSTEIRRARQEQTNQFLSAVTLSYFHRHQDKSTASVACNTHAHAHART